MNESNKLIENKSKIALKRKELNLKVKVDKRYITSVQQNNKYIGLAIIIFLIIILISLFILKLFSTKNINYNLININEINKYKDTQNDESIYDNKPFDKFLKLKFNTEKIKNEKKYYEDNPRCNELDPINIFNRRLQDKSTTICQDGISRHICYKNNDPIFVSKDGVICTMENIIIDPSFWKSSGYIYKGPVDKERRGSPILKKGFFNMKCGKDITKIKGYDFIYKTYFQSWNYNYYKKKMRRN